MFSCQNCNQPSRPGESPTLVVTETRPHTHPPRYRAQDLDEWGNPKPKRRPFDPGGEGTQIVSENTWCPRCVEAAGGHDQLSTTSLPTPKTEAQLDREQRQPRR